MTVNVWEKFDRAIDTKALKEDVKVAAENNQGSKEVIQTSES